MLYDDATVRRVLRAAHEGQDWCDVALKNDVKLRTAYRWINAAEDSGNWEALPRKPRGGKRHSKIQDEHVDYLVGLIDDNCYITLDEMVDALEARFALKQTHRDNNYRNLEENKILRRDYVVELIAQKAAGKKIFYGSELSTTTQPAKGQIST
ncbi:uncharacterized protein PITG_01554 [Phytophthora infestans T30-4]|uniref:Uncharacterized protein n=1 Tax=Phytophthora infestans (strain T30-4) TaxID=403677 RepID=D0MTI6_PHYIT|nr:uncharacterized protein PITG_01554 [Phytophthora infestans T30-4]EEY61283.1 conserved hypothetical protein [Phytophthora infestans T30-4]|eukprot:XP_002908200.1 conserved hypothetical protein [Phytophthora infestans T30-4]